MFGLVSYKTVTLSTYRHSHGIWNAVGSYVSSAREKISAILCWLHRCIGQILGYFRRSVPSIDMLRRYSTTAIQFKRSLAEALILNMVMPTLEHGISSQRFNHPRTAWRRDYCSRRSTSTWPTTDHLTTAGHQLHMYATRDTMPVE